MYSRVLTASLLGLECEKVWAEADVENGLPSFSIVGLANRSIRESKERIRSAIINCGYDFPDTRITVNLTPAGVKKEGSHFDLAIALGVLLSGECIKTGPGFLETAFLGELTLDGRLDPVMGILPMIIGLREAGIRNVVLPEANIREACLVEDMKLFPAKSLFDVIMHVIGNKKIESFKSLEIPTENRFAEIADFVDIKGQESVKRAAQIAAAGFHGMLLVGPPGVGKTMIGKRIPGIMPELSYDQKLEVTQIYSIAGMLTDKTPIITKRPFRSPHHGITAAGLIGGGSGIPRPGEVSLAHNGVLFLDEFPEFQASVLDTLRQPMEDGQVSIVRASAKLSYPSHFMLVAAMNPCRCGYYGDPVRKCSCTESDRIRYVSRVSGPLLDRIDIHVAMKRPTYMQITEKDLPLTKLDTSSLKAGVERAANIQAERYKKLEISSNSELTPQLIKHFCPLEKEEAELMKEAFSKWDLSARSYHRILKLSRTIADVEGSERIMTSHILEALSYRLPERFIRHE